MTTLYRTLCQVRLRHDYFTSGVLTSLTATPTPATAVRMRRAGLLFRADPGGFTLLYTNTSPYTPLTRLKETFPLVFGLAITDPAFANYTDLPLLQPGPGATYCLRPAPDVPLGPIGAGELLLLRPLVFAQPLTAPHAAGSVQLLSYPAGPPTTAPTQWPVPADAPAVTFDLRPWGSGSYQLLLNDQSTLSLYADDALYHARPWGVLEIGAAVLAAALAAVPPAVPQYTLTFEARAAYWQYQLTARTPPLSPYLSIGGGPPVQFGPVQPGPGIAASYLAQQPIRFAQRYSQAPFQLLLQAGQRGAPPQVVLPALPQASPANLRIDSSAAAPRFIADIFVQV